MSSSIFFVKTKKDTVLGNNLGVKNQQTEGATKQCAGGKFTPLSCCPPIRNLFSKTTVLVLVPSQQPLWQEDRRVCC